MYKIKTVARGSIAAEAKDRPPFGPGFTEIPEGTVRMEVWGSSFDDPGPDFCEFRLMAADGSVLASKRVAGY